MEIVLNADILGEIACKLDTRDFISFLSVCKQWNRVGEDDKVWKRLAQRDYSQIPKQEDQTWKQLYKTMFHYHNVQYFEEVTELPCPTQKQVIGLSFSDLLYLILFRICKICVWCTQLVQTS
jgi:hypothetical protein